MACLKTKIQEKKTRHKNVFANTNNTGIQTRHKNVFAKVHVKSLFKKIDRIQKLRCQFSLDFFGFIAFSDVSQRWEFKNTTKNSSQKNGVEKVLQKSRQKVQS
jgi:hypothetical protein